MAKINIIPSTQEHAEIVSANVRPEDAEELWATSYSRPEDVLSRALEYSEYALTGFIDDVPVCIWGVVSDSLLFNDGTPWMVGTHDLNNDRMAIAFLRHCRVPIMVMAEKYDKLENYVDARNKRSIKWLKYMGFTVEKDSEPYGVLRMPFHRFWMEKETKDV